MAGNRKSGGSNVALTTRKRRSGGAWVDITTAKRRSGGTWVDLFPAFTAQLTDRTVTASAVSPADATAAYKLDLNGSVYEAINNGADNLLETWRLSGTSADFESRATLNSGTLSTGTTGVWQVLSSSSVWTTQNTNDLDSTVSAGLTIEIRRVSDSVVVASAAVSLVANVVV